MTVGELIMRLNEIGEDEWDDEVWLEVGERWTPLESVTVHTEERFKDRVSLGDIPAD